MKITVDISRIKDLAAKLGDINPQTIGETAVRVVNAVADETYALARPRMIETINLSDAYVQERMTVVHASNPNDASATITAVGSGVNMTILARYGARQLTTPAVRAKGDTRRGIPAGMKQAGVSVEVTRGSVKDIPGGYLMNLKGGNGEGLFTRSADGRQHHRYGPSVYQLFNRVASGMMDEVEENLSTHLAEEIKAQITKALE